MIPIPTENRATISAYREGRTESQFLDDMWKRRDAEHPGRRKSRGKWPMEQRDHKPISNVRPLRGNRHGD